MSARVHKPMPKRQSAIAFAAVFGLTLAATACGDPESPAVPEPSRPAAITITPALAEFVSLGERAAFTATISDQYGAAFPGTVSWSSSDEAVFAVEADGTAVAAGNGTGTLTAAFEGISATAEVIVRQVPASLLPIPGNTEETGAGALNGGLVLVPAKATAWPVAVQVLDAAGSPVAGVPVTFTPDEGHGLAEPEIATTSEDGIARTMWTPGSAEGAQALRAAFAGGSSVQATAMS